MKKKKLFIGILVLLLFSFSYGQEVIEKIKTGNYIEGLTYIKSGEFAGKFAFIDSWSVYSFDPDTGTYEKMFYYGDLSFNDQARGIAFISSGQYAGNFLLNERLTPSTLFIVSPEGTLVSEVNATELPRITASEGITEITSGLYEGKFAMLEWANSQFELAHILIFRIEEIGGTVNAYLEADISSPDLGNRPLSICFLSSDYPDPLYRNHFAIGDYKKALNIRVVDESGNLKAIYPVDSQFEGLDYDSDEEKFYVSDYYAVETWVMNLDGTDKYRYNIMPPIEFPQATQLAWLDDTNQIMLSGFWNDPGKVNRICFISRKNPGIWEKDSQLTYTNPNLNSFYDMTELTHAGYYYMVGYKFQGQYFRKVQKTDSDFNLISEYILETRFDKICYMHDSKTGIDQFAILQYEDRTNVYLFNDDFSGYELIDLSGEVERMNDFCYDSEADLFYVLDSSRLIHVFNSKWEMVAEYDISDLIPRGIGDFDKITSGDLKGTYALFNQVTSEIVIADLEPHFIQSKMDILQEKVQISDILNGIKNSLVNKLENAMKSLENGNINAAINKIHAFQNEVKAQRGKKISEELADQWIEWAVGIIEDLEE